MAEIAQKRASIDPGNVLPSHLDLYYGGRWHAPRAGEYVATINPANGQVIARIAHAGAEDADAAIAAAYAAFRDWGRTTPLDRAARLKDAARILRGESEALAMLDALNTGNPVAQMVADAKMAAQAMEYFAGLVTEIKGE